MDTKAVAPPGVTIAFWATLGVSSAAASKPQFSGCQMTIRARSLNGRCAYSSVAVIDVGKPATNLGWSMTTGTRRFCGPDIDQCIKCLADALEGGPLALGFEAPLFVPMREDSNTMTRPRKGECVGGVNRPFSAGPGCTVLVTGLVLVPYVLKKLRKAAPDAKATFDWRSPPAHCNQLLLFEAFVTNQQNRGGCRHVEDARLAVDAFQRGMRNPNRFKSSIEEPDCFNLIAASLLRTGWTTDVRILSEECLVVRA